MVALIVPIAIVGWRWTGGDADDAGAAVEVRSPTSTVVQFAATTTTVRSTTTTRPVVTAPLPSTTLRPARRIIISGEMKECRFGANCLAASFVIEGFEPHPGSYICIYPNSSTEIGFNDNDVTDACLTADQGDTITIEIDGVRSATISEVDLDGTG